MEEYAASQPFFTERQELEEHNDDHNGNFDNKESQSLISYNKYGNKRDSKISFHEGDLPDSQPMFTEIDIFPDSTKDKKIMTKKYESEISEAKSNDKSNQQESKTDTKNEDKIPTEACIECVFDKELDKRNYYFGNLLIGELQFLPPCMRSEAYMTILKYVDSLKQQHRNRVNN